MGQLYGVWDDIPDDIADHVLHDDIPVGPPDDPDTADAELEDDDLEEPKP